MSEWTSEERAFLVRDLARSAAALESIARHLEAIVPVEVACPHPADERQDYSAMGQSRWVCKLCGFRHGMEAIDGQAVSHQ